MGGTSLRVWTCGSELRWRRVGVGVGESGKEVVGWWLSYKDKIVALGGCKSTRSLHTTSSPSSSTFLLCLSTSSNAPFTLLQ